MTAAHFLRDDFVSTLLAAGLFLLFAVPPGYILGWLTGLLDFRKQTLAWRFVISVPVSISVVPILAYWLDLLGGRPTVWTGFAIGWVVFAGVLVGDLRRNEIRIAPLSKSCIAFILLAMAWAVIAFGSLVDLPLGGDRLYLSITTWDQSYRVPFTDTITRTGIAHPVNPMFYLDGPVPLRYHYFWFILCSLVDQAGGAWVTARHAFFASVFWCGIALACAIAAYLRFFVSNRDPISPRWIFKGILLLAVTGLDIIPTISLMRFSHILYTDMEAWNEAVTSWLGSLLWVPHGVASLVAGVTGFLILFHAPSLERPPQRWMTAALAGVLLATMLGDDIYVSLVIAAFLTLWTVVSLCTGLRNHTALLMVAGMVTAVVALPYLISLTAAARPGGFLHFTVRDFHGGRALGLSTEFPKLWETYLARLAFLPLNYLLELGFFLIVGILYLSRIRRLRRFEPYQMAAAVMVSTSVFICTFFKSGASTNNDLAWRGFLPAQFMLLIWAVELLRSRREPPQEQWTASSRLYAILAPALPLLLVIGLVSTAYSAGTLRMAEISSDGGAEHVVGKRNLAARRVYEELRQVLPATAVVQQNPALDNPVYWGIYADRQTAVEGFRCGNEFGGTGDGCAEFYPALVAIFDSGAQADQVETLCRRLHIDVLVVTSGDPVWSNPDSWVWKKTPLVSANDVRAFLMKPASFAESR